MLSSSPSPGSQPAAPLQIAMISASLSGGFGKQVHLLATKLARLGHDITLFLPGDAARPAGRPAYRVFRVGRTLPLGKYRSLVNQWPFAAALLRIDFSRFDIVHGHGFAMLGARGARYYVRTFYGSAIDEARHASVTSIRRFGWLVYQLYNVALEQVTGPLTGNAVGISPATQRRLRFVTSVVPCGVDLDQYGPVPIDLKSGCPTVLSVGTTYRGRKRLWLLAEEFENVVKPVLPDAELWLVTRERVTTPGIRTFRDISEEQLVDLYQRAWVFCLPSTYEGFGVPYIEAMATGTAVVASPNPGADWILQGGHVGVLAREGRLGQELLHLLTDPPRRARYRERGLERVRDFSAEQAACAYERMYRDLLEKGSPPQYTEAGSCTSGVRRLAHYRLLSRLVRKFAHV